MSKRAHEEQDPLVKVENGADLPSPKKKKAKTTAKGQGQRAGRTVWDDPEMAALWKGIYSLAKSNVPQLMAIKELQDKGRSSANLHCKIDQMFVALTGEKKR